MKKALWTASIALGLLLGSFFLASAINCPTSYPLSLSNWTSGCVIPSSWANALETTIGTTTSATSLEQQVAAIASSTVSSSTITGTPFYVPYWTASGFGFNQTSSIYVATSGNVGIGVATPLTAVDVSSTMDVRRLLSVGTTTLGNASQPLLVSGGIRLIQGNSIVDTGWGFLRNGATGNSGGLFFNTNGIGVSTTAPNATLQVAGTFSVNATSTFNGTITANQGIFDASGNPYVTSTPVQRWMKPYQWTEAAYNATTSATSTVYLLETPVPFRCTASAIAITAGSTTDSTDPVLVGIYGPVTTDTAASASLIVSATTTFSVSNAGVTIPFGASSVLAPGTYYLGVQFSSSSINYVAQQDQVQVAGWSQTYAGTSTTALPSTIGSPASNGTFIPNMELECSSN